MKTALAISCVFAFGAATAAEPSLLPDRVDKAIGDRIANGDYPALVIAVVDGDHNAVYAFGKLDNGKAPDADTVFEIGSASKTFTATLLAEAVLDGKLKLEEPVAALLPGFTIPARAGKTITLENLATQHSGLPRLPSNLAPKDANDPYADYGGERLKAFLAGYQLTRDPGAKYEYSNLGVGLLGYALAQHAGMSYDALLHREILDPLGMHRSGIALNADLRAHLAGGHDAQGKRVVNWNFDALAGAGGIKSTAADMLRFLQANMGVTRTPLYAAMQFAQKPRVDALDADNPIGLVWMTRKDKGGDIVWHNGETGGYTSFIGFTADRRHGVVVLTNEAVPVDDLGLAMLDPKAGLASTHKSVAIKPELLDAYVGSYQLEPNFILRIVRNGDQLYAQATGQGAFPIYASADDEFFAKVAAIGISFRHDASRKVTSLVLHQGGDRVAQRVADAQADAAQDHKTMAVDPATLAAYVGHYQLAPGAVFTITVKDGQLMSQLSGQGDFPVFASARDKFFYKVVDAQIDFERDAMGTVIALVLRQNATDQRAARVDSH